VILAVVAAAFWFDRMASEPGPLPEETTVFIPRGTGVQEIAGILETAGVVDDAFLTALRVRWRGDGRDLRAGEYAFPAAVSLDQVLDDLAAGRTVVHRVSVPEGLTSAQIAALINGTEELGGMPVEVPGEGTLLPETYHYELGDTRQVMVERMTAAMDAALEKLWVKRDPEIAVDSPEEAVILASIVEKETGVPDERAHIAGVFYNRLKRGMPLQSDPTVIYALTGGAEDLGRALTRKDLEVDDPYNTYRNAGLPPGPIANPGVDALVAVLHPLETDDLYFVADGTGGHAFARTLDEHNRNVAAYRDWLKEQN
jgi:UPF0755 protein